MASLTEELIERIGGTAGIGAVGLAALFLAPQVARPLGRGLRALAKGAIKGYLIVAHRTRAAVEEATDEWQSLYDEARAEISGEAPGRDGRVRQPAPEARGPRAEAPGAPETLAPSTAPHERGGERETILSHPAPGASARVNLNEADKETLMTLPGVGERTAEKILQYRHEHGRIGSLKELQEAGILFESTASHLQDYVSCD